MTALIIIGTILFGFNCFILGTSWEDITRDYGYWGRLLFIVFILSVGFLFNIYDVLSDGVKQLFNYLWALTQIDFWFRYYFMRKSFDAKFNAYDEIMVERLGWKLQKYTSKRSGLYTANLRKCAYIILKRQRAAKLKLVNQSH